MNDGGNNMSMLTGISAPKVKKLITVTLLASCLSTPAFTDASSNNNGNGGKGPGWFGKVLGANLSNDHDLSTDTDQARKTPGPLPPPPGDGGPNAPFMPPPPPPPMGSSDIDDDGSKDGAERQRQPPPPPLADKEMPRTTNEIDRNKEAEQWNQPWDMHTNTNMNRNTNTNRNMQSPPPQEYNGWHPQMQYQNQPPQQWMGDDQGQSIYQLQSEIDHLVNHQQDLYGQVQNLTGTLIETERANEMHMSQIDLLLEQVADVEAYASAESNAALEFKANCTALGGTLLGMQSSLQNLEKQCQDLTEGRKCDEEEIQHLNAVMKKKERELENMACGIEMARLGKQKEAYHAEYERKKIKKNGGVFSWLFGWSYDGSYSNDDSESDDEMERLQEKARSTLLNALQMERNNVEELEISLAMVQQNNSAIGEMVSSRDSLIDELNDRIAVFEEDKVVLKAALRQLQKEMKDEAPKTKKLMKELKAANSGIKKLDRTIEFLKGNHTEEIATLDEELSLKDNHINETDSRMAMISVYVDQLEERLASFAIARRDIILREEKCDVLVNKTIAVEDELSQLISESEEIKAERSALQSEKETLVNDNEELRIESRALREELHLVNDNISRLESEADITTQQLEEASASIASKEKVLDEFQAQDKESTLKLAEQEEMIGKTVDVTMALQKELWNVHRESEETISMLEEKIEDGRKEKQGADATIAELKQRVEEFTLDAAYNSNMKSFPDEEYEMASHVEKEAVEQASEQPTAVAPPPPPSTTLSEGITEESQILEDADKLESIFGDIVDIDDDYQNDGAIENLQDDTSIQSSYGSDEFPQADADIYPTERAEHDFDESSTHDTFEQIASDGPMAESEQIEHYKPYSDNDSQSENSCILSDDDVDSLERGSKTPNADNELDSESTIGNDQIDLDFDDEEISLVNSEDVGESATKSTPGSLYSDEAIRANEEEPSFPIGDSGKAEERKDAFVTKGTVPLRGLRKQASRVTGIHGFFTPLHNENRK